MCLQMRAGLLLIALVLTGCPTRPDSEPGGSKESATTALACGPGESSCSDDGTNCNCADKSSANGRVVPAAQAKVGDRTRCPVSGGTFVVRSDTEFVSHQGKRYPVCCSGCATRFRSTPEQFVEGV